MSKLLNEREKRVLANHQRTLRSAVRSFKDVVEKDRSRAPSASKLDARRYMWQFSSVRQSMQDEMEDIVRSLCKGIAPDDLDLRIARIALAMYLMDTCQDMLNAAIEKGNTSMVSVFHTAFEATRKILSDDYFTKGKKRIINDFLDGELPIKACAECAGMSLLSMESAVARYKMRVADELDAIPDVA